MEMSDETEIRQSKTRDGAELANTPCSASGVEFAPDIMVTAGMAEAGSQIASDLVGASISFHMGGLGGAKNWEEFEAGHSGRNMDLIRRYINDEIDSVTAIYLAMHRASIKPNAKGEAQPPAQNL